MLKKNERGSIMVETLAVIALMGLMGTVLYRQIQRRNEELDNINMASEIRMVKEATTAYIQDHRAMLEQLDFCTDDEGADYIQADNDAVDGYMPTNWACDETAPGNCLVYEYDIWLACDPVGTGDRKMIRGLVVPKEDNLPVGFNLRRAARVANLIGADGGIHDGGVLYGTQGAWEDLCGEPCDGRDTDAFHVATPGMYVYIPEVDASAANAVAIPTSLALNELHTNSYFSVGGGSDFNCVGNYDATAGRYAHEDLIDNVAAQDTILHVGQGAAGSPCDPLFWVGTAVGDPDQSEAGHVYVKKNLYVGRENANQRQAIALETGDTNTSRQIVVYDKDGKDTLTLNADGQIIGRTNSDTGMGFQLDPENGEIALFEERNATLTIGGVEATGKIRLPGLRLSKDGKILTNVTGRYYDDEGNTVTEEYGIDPANTSLMHDVRLTSRGGARLSEILPDYIAKGIETVEQNSATTNYVDKPTCPKGYVRAVTVTPVSYTQGVSGGQLSVSIGAGGGTVTDDNPVDGTGALTLTNKEPVRIAITDGGSGHENQWNVALTYGGNNPGATDPISALAQTYCVYTTAGEAASTSFKRDARGENNEMLTPLTACDDVTKETVCINAAECVGGVCPAKECSESDGANVDGNTYCFGHRRVYVECLTTAQCGDAEKVCNTVTHRCDDMPDVTEPAP